ncbi:MAG: TIGR03067 domain-containing protein [Planctomycetes bacterium]|nr:TIGR03067 domain-containing protein [Planctomycetota bacterium]
MRNGLLQEGTTPWEDEDALVDPRPAPTPAMIEEAKRADRKRLQGTWSLSPAAVGGPSSDAREKARWIIDGNKIVMELEQRREGKFTLDPAKSPRRIDIVTAATDDEKSEEIHGVYELSGDDIYVCLSSGDEPRPTSLRASRGTAQVSFALKRERP